MNLKGNLLYFISFNSYFFFSHFLKKKSEVIQLLQEGNEAIDGNMLEEMVWTMIDCDWIEGVKMGTAIAEICLSSGNSTVDRLSTQIQRNSLLASSYTLNIAQKLAYILLFPLVFHSYQHFQSLQSNFCILNSLLTNEKKKREVFLYLFHFISFEFFSFKQTMLISNKKIRVKKLKMSLLFHFFHL